MCRAAVERLVCSEEVSSEARTCPRCGHPLGSRGVQRSQLKRIGATTLAVALVILQIVVQSIQEQLDILVLAFVASILRNIIVEGNLTFATDEDISQDGRARHRFWTHSIVRRVWPVLSRSWTRCRYCFVDNLCIVARRPYARFRFATRSSKMTIKLTGDTATGSSRVETSPDL